MVETVVVGPAGTEPNWVEPIPGTRGWRAVLLPPATYTWPPMVTAAAPASGSGRRPVMLAVRRAGSMTWIVVTGWPACGPVTARPPKTKIFPPDAVTAG